MNWYKHHIGDYESHTSHLSILEDGIYSRLLRRYYLTERPLPNDLKELARLTRARSRHEVDALGRCVNLYFSLLSDGLLHNSRADKEILKYQALCATNRTIARGRSVDGTSQKRGPNQNLEPITKALDLSSYLPRINSHPQKPFDNSSKPENQEPDALSLRAQAAGITQREDESRGQFALRVAQATPSTPEPKPTPQPKGKFED